jgi:hypothetical protein
MRFNTNDPVSCCGHGCVGRGLPLRPHGACHYGASW